jgi:hypothetical protein
MKKEREISKPHFLLLPMAFFPPFPDASYFSSQTPRHLRSSLPKRGSFISAMQFMFHNHHSHHLSLHLVSSRRSPPSFLSLSLSLALSLALCLIL